MRQFLWLLSVCLLIPNAYAYDREKLLKAYFSTVLIRGYKADGSLAYGTGVIIAKNKVLTNCHTFHESSKPWVSQGEDVFYINSAQVDREHDLCLLSTDTLPGNPVPIGSSAGLKKGQQVVSIGHSSGNPAPVTSVGIVKSLYPMHDAFVIRTNARFSLGASGSGLYDTQGNLIGINTFKTVGKLAYFYAMPIEWLKELETRPEETKFPLDGKAFWENTEKDSPYFMQAAAPELQEDWSKLLETAKKWTAAESNSTEAWYTLGLAQDGLKNATEAEASYRKALTLNPENPDALYKIGLIASAKGNKQEVDSVNLALMKINEDIAEAFGKEAAGCSAKC